MVCLGLYLSAVHLLPALDVPVLVGRCLYASRVVSSLVLRGSSLSLLLFGGFGGVAVSFFCLIWRLGCLRFGPLSPASPPSLPPWLSSGAFWSGPVVIPLAWRVVADWLVSSFRFMATKASALCGALPSPPCCGCCSCAPRCGTEVFALG